MIKIALVGVSHWHAEFHAASFLSAGAVLSGVQDADGAKASMFAEKYHCPSFRDIHEMLRAVKPEFVMALGKHADLPAIALKLLETGIPFGIEKPLGLNASDVAAVAEEAKKRKAFVAVPLVNRYSLIWEKIEELKKQGRLGKPVHSHFRVVNGTASRYPALGVSWMLDPALSGGGCLRNLGIHGADAFLSLCEGKPEVLCARLQYTGSPSTVEDYAVALVGNSAHVGIVESGYSYATREAGGDFEWRIATTNCYLLDRGTSLTVSTLDDGKTETIPNLSSSDRYDRFGPDTLERLGSGRPPIADPEDCFKAMELLDSIYGKGSVE